MRRPRTLSRRQFVAMCGATAAATGLGRSAAASDNARILIVGDSMIAGGFGLYLARDLAKDHGHPVHRRGKSSSGLARPDFFDWPEEARRLTEEFRPDASVVMFGGNDVQGLYMGKGEWIRWHEPGWSQEYAERVVQLAEILAPQHERIFWVGMPPMRPPKFHARVQRVNWIYRAEMAIRPGGLFVDAWPVLADEEGEYADRIAPAPDAKKVRVRAGDGIHLSPAGARLLADHVRDLILHDLANT